MVSRVNLGFKRDACTNSDILDAWGRCRWSTNTDEPLLFVKYYFDKLNILDSEKKGWILAKPVALENDQCKF